MVTAKAATEESSRLFEQALETFETAMKTGMKIQEETAQLLLDMMNQFGSPQELQNRAQEYLKDAMPTAQKNMDSAVELMNQNMRTSLDLLKKALETGQSESMNDAQARTRELWEHTLGAMRTNTQAIVQANTQLLEAWAALARGQKPAATAGKKS